MHKLGLSGWFTEICVESELVSDLMEVDDKFVRNHPEITAGMIASNVPDYIYIVRLRGETEAFTTNDREFFDRVNLGDRLQVDYERVYEVFSNYVPPNFDNKQVVKRVFRQYQFIRAKKVN